MRDVLLHPYSSVEKAYHKALKIEEYLSTFSSNLTPPYLIVPHFGQPKHGSMIVGSQVSSTVNLDSSTTKINFNKAYGFSQPNSRLPSSHIECHHCHTEGHIASHCPQCILTLECVYVTKIDDDEDIEVINPIVVDNDDDLSLDDDFDDFDDPT